LTLRELVARTARRFARAHLHFGHGTDNPRDEAAYLVLRALKLPFEAGLDRPLSALEMARVDSLVEKRIRERVPVAYLLREAWLDRHAFYVDRRVIIPRSHIAELLREGLRPWLRQPVSRVLDLCTGSGCLAILAAHAFARARVDASDLSVAALAVAQRNVAQYRLQRRVALIRSDLYASLGKKRYDLILANPPYVTTAAMRKLSAEYRYEPGIALAGGRNGLEFISRILAGAPDHLAHGGLLVCEVGDNRAAVEAHHGRMALVWPKDEVFIFLASRTAAVSRTPPTRPRGK
jgi:ribosomal protein L3 glutamine methyltransferase